MRPREATLLTLFQSNMEMCLLGSTAMAMGEAHLSTAQLQMIVWRSEKRSKTHLLRAGRNIGTTSPAAQFVEDSYGEIKKQS